MRIQGPPADPLRAEDMAAFKETAVSALKMLPARPVQSPPLGRHRRRGLVTTMRPDGLEADG